MPGINTADDEFDAAWLDGGKAIVFARSPDANNAPSRLFIAQCDGTVYTAAPSLALSFNTAGGNTPGPVVDLSKSAELLVSGIAPPPSARKMDIYRLRTPNATGNTGCLPMR